MFESELLQCPADLTHFMDLGFSVLKHHKSGFLSEIGEIEICLLIHISDDEKQELRCEICSINEQDKLFSKNQIFGNDAYRIIQLFLYHFPKSLFSTGERRPLCIFSKQDNDNDKTKLGTFLGYMSFDVFQKCYQTNTNAKKKLHILVP